MGGRRLLHNKRGILWNLATATNRAQAGGSSSSIHLPLLSGFVAAKRGTKTRAVGFKWWWWWGVACCSQFKSFCVSDYVKKGMLGVYRKLARHRRRKGRGLGAGVAHFPVPPEEAGMAASSTLRLPETVVTPAVVFDNAARAQPTGRRHNETNRCTSQTRGRGVISNDSGSKRKKTKQTKKNRLP